MKAKSAKGARTRDRILAAAATLVRKSGVNGTSVDDVLKASGTGKSQFYHYFGSKTLMVRELIDWQLERLPAVQQEVLAGLDSWEGIEAWFEQIVADFESGLYENGCPIGNLASELSCDYSELRDSLQETFALWEEALAAGLRSMQTQGALGPEADPDALACHALATLQGALVLAKTARSSRPLKVSLGQLGRHLRTLAGTPRAGGTAKSIRPQRPKRKARGFCP